MADGLVNLFSTRAHVFQINPETKNSWLPKGDSAIPISFVARDLQPSRRELKIIGTGDNGETVLDSVILPKTVFTKRSQKFGQWSDHTGMIYGLGFGCEADLNEFVDTFQQLQRDLLSSTLSLSSNLNNPSAGPQNTLSASAQPDERATGWSKAQPSTNISSEMSGRDYNTTAISSKSSIEPAQVGSQLTGGMAGFNQFSNTLAHPGHQQARRQQNQSTSEISDHDSNNNNNGLNGNGSRYPRSQSMYGMQQKSTAGYTPETDNSQSDWQLKEQLKYENERLKQALEESSKNTGVWHSELINLRTNNAKLTQALQESKAHVGEWEKELMNLRVENKDLKLRIMTLESTSDPEKTNDYKAEIQKYKAYVDEVQSQLRKKENEFEDLQKSMEQLEIRANAVGAQNGRSDDTTVEAVISTYQKQKFDSINEKLEAKIGELRSIQEEYTKLADKLYH